MEAIAASGGSARLPGRIGAFRPFVVVSVAALTAAHGRLVALLQRRRTGNRAETWELPSRVPIPSQALEDAASAELQARSGFPAGFLEQLHTWAEPGGDDESLLEVAYLCLIAPPPAPSVAQAEESCWWPVASLPPLRAAEHAVLELGVDRLRQRLTCSSAAASLLPAEFSLSELQQVHEAVQGRLLDKRNFRKRILASGLLEPTLHERRDGAHRPARLYRFRAGEAGIADVVTR